MAVAATTKNAVGRGRCQGPKGVAGQGVGREGRGAGEGEGVVTVEAKTMAMGMMTGTKAMAGKTGEASRNVYLLV